eukprot:SAG22_NODE_11402_length_487_cov_0.518041_2_plen_52_part_01
MYIDSSDIELMDDPGSGGEQLVGIRFGPINIPAGGKLLSANIDLIIDEVKDT